MEYQPVFALCSCLEATGTSWSAGCLGSVKADCKIILVVVSWEVTCLVLQTRLGAALGKYCEGSHVATVTYFGFLSNACKTWYKHWEHRLTELFLFDSESREFWCCVWWILIHWGGWQGAVLVMYSSVTAVWLKCSLCLVATWNSPWQKNTPHLAQAEERAMAPAVWLKVKSSQNGLEAFVIMLFVLCVIGLGSCR